MLVDSWLSWLDIAPSSAYDLLSYRRYRRCLNSQMHLVLIRHYLIE
ncbi:hypothetical protein MGSAQ_002223 [marine sediment metagenome]|uniref:Uncharacterized protein n=1 Tax=marine sediment metagenome TaxID=412755 RepID=A0A1B6NSI8_9ZZZZ